jgi:hypothetical protein
MRVGNVRAGRLPGLMKRLRTIVVLAAVALGLSACSASPPAVSPSTTPSAASPSPVPVASVPTTTVTSGSTTIVQIGPYAQEFGTSLPTDATQAQIIASFRNSQVLWFQSIFAGHALPLLKQYVVGTAFADFLKAVHASNGGGIEPSGRDLLYDIDVTGLSRNEAAIATCDYHADTASRYRTTGKLVPGSTPSSVQDYQSQTWHLVRESKHWALASFSAALLPSAAARQCEVSPR